MNAGRPGIVTDYSLRESEPCVNVESTVDDGRE